MAALSHAIGEEHAIAVEARPSRAIRPAALVLALCALTVTTTTVLALGSGHVEHRVAAALVLSYDCAAPMLVGLVWLRRRPASRFGPL
ncbi:MAG TPA: hypothetical protein VHB30_01285, partial [Solirubrobacteraceae bacterium]|nr:hypothetical protein [Solirubrobacteraceae bacterium]